MSSSSSTTFRGLELVPRTPRDARDTEAQQHATLSHSSSESMLAGTAGPRHLRGMKNIPLGMDLLHRSLGRKFNYNWYKASVLIITFLAYMGYHASRKPPSIVKSVLRGPHGGIAPSTATAPSANYSAAVRTADSLGRHLFAPELEIEEVEIDPSLIGNGWAPFNARNGQTLLGQVDLCFLGVYAIGMFFAGHLGDRMDLRIFLTAGMLLSGIFICLFGAGYFVDNHQASYYMLVSAAAGLFQSTGWPSVVAIVANWSGKGKRGLVMGIWNAHTSVGNILGTMIAASCLSAGWGWAFIVPGLLMIFLAAVVFLFLVVQPSDVGFTTPQDLPPEEMEALILKEKEKEKASGGEVESIAFLDAWRIPGVASYAACLFFSKLIAYTFLYWLPYYIKSTPIEGRFLSPKEAGDLSVLFDVGGVAGGVLAGHLSDKSGASALVATSFTLLAVPCLYLYRSMGYMSFSINILLMMLSGFFVNGPYALITTAVSADLGTHESLQGNAKALATVSAIIDGMGSIGAAIGPMMTGVISEWGGFDMVFAMLYTAAFTAGLLIIKLAARELGTLRGRTSPPGK